VGYRGRVLDLLRLVKSTATAIILRLVWTFFRFALFSVQSHCRSRLVAVLGLILFYRYHMIIKSILHII
jgi:hypothetical protein